MRLIDLEPILRKKMPLLVMLDEILSAPSLDLVRCGECKYHYGEYCFRLVSKEAWIVLGSQCVITMQPDDFCSYGERKENE